MSKKKAARKVVANLSKKPCKKCGKKALGGPRGTGSTGKRRKPE